MKHEAILTLIAGLIVPLRKRVQNWIDYYFFGKNTSLLAHPFDGGYAAALYGPIE